MKNRIFKRIVSFGMTAVISASMMGTALAAEMTPNLAVASSNGNVSTVTVNASTPSLKLKIGQSVTLVLKTNYGNINGSKMTNWKSSSKSIAKVSSKGVVTALKSGTATVSAKYKGKTYKAKIIVSAPKLTGYSKMKNFLNTYGYVGYWDEAETQPYKYYSVVTKSNPNNVYSAIYDPATDKIEFMTSYTSSTKEIVTNMYFRDENATRAYFDTYVTKNGQTYTASTSFKPASFKKTSTPSYRFTGTPIYSTKTHNKYIHDSLYGWSYIADLAGTSLYRMGFLFYTI